MIPGNPTGILGRTGFPKKTSVSYRRHWRCRLESLAQVAFRSYYPVYLSAIEQKRVRSLQSTGGRPSKLHVLMIAGEIYISVSNDTELLSDREEKKKEKKREETLHSAVLTDVLRRSRGGRRNPRVQLSGKEKQPGELYLTGAQRRGKSLGKFASQREKMLRS